MKLDRSKFKKAELSQVKESISKVEKSLPKKSDSKFTNFFSVSEGKNVFRVLPGLGNVVYAPLKVSKLQCEVPTYNEKGEQTGKEVKSKNVFCADIHGEKLLKGKDPIISYINKVKRIAEEEYQDAEERKKFLNPITGYRSKKGFVWGIQPTVGYICYALNDEGEIGRLQLRMAWMKEIQKISANMSEDDTLSLDIFSGVDDGYPLIITGEKDDKGKVTYSVSAMTLKRGEDWDEFFEKHAVSDEDLEKLASLPTLDELYIDSYSKRDFNMALDGLKRFDEENGYNIFEDDEFLNEIESMAELIPDDDNTSSEEDEKPKKSSKKEEPEEKEYPSIAKMKKALREYIEEEYDDEELPELNKKELQEWYDLMKEGEPLPFDDYKEEDSEEDKPSKEDPEEDEEDEKPTKSASDRIRNLRAKYAKNQ